MITKIDGKAIHDAEDLHLTMPIYKLIEYSSNYSKTTGSLWFYSKDEAIDFNADIFNDNNFKSFKYKAKSLGNTVAQAADATNGILKNAKIAVPLKCLNNFWKPLEMPLINCKVKLKLKWSNYCVLSAAGNDNVDGNNDNIVFTIKDTKLYVSVVTLLARDNQKLSKNLSKGFERSVYWNEYKTKSENKNTTNEHRYFLESNVVGVNTLFVLVYSNEDADSKRLKAKRYY